MKKNTSIRLRKISSDVLADTLLNLAKRSDEAQLAVERLTRTSSEAYKSTMRSISALNRSTRYVDWHEIPDLARKLENIIQDVASIDITDVQRFDLICRFIETDEATFERVDDSSGDISDVYRDSALDIFQQCVVKIATTDQDLIATKLEHLLASNDYGIRDCLLNTELINNLNEASNRHLISRFSARSDQVKEIDDARTWLGYIMLIARHLKDTKLFELSALESVADFDEVPVSTNFKIAINYFNCGDFDEAKNWMDKISDTEKFDIAGRNQFMIVLHEKLGNHADRDNVALADFNRNPSKDALQDLLVIIGEERRSEIVDTQLKRISAEKQFSEDSLAFLIETEFLDSASAYTLRNRDSINGDVYWCLPRQGKALLTAGCSLAAICIYRSLLNSVLRRGNTKSYYYGARYLVILDKLSDTDVADGMIDHQAYVRNVKQLHGRKHSFWRKYDAACLAVKS